VQQIESASKEYAEAKERFDAVEQEYVCSKLDMQRKADLKERLTEHLMIIIQENETRKAEKLHQLMTKMSLWVTISARPLSELLDVQRGEPLHTWMRFRLEIHCPFQKGWGAVPPLPTRASGTLSQSLRHTQPFTRILFN
jgi:hypothetical protein